MISVDSMVLLTPKKKPGLGKVEVTIGDATVRIANVTTVNVDRTVVVLCSLPQHDVVEFVYEVVTTKKTVLLRSATPPIVKEF